MAFKDDDVNIPEFIRQLSAALGQDLFNDPMISQLGIGEIMNKYLNIAKQTTAENEYLKKKIRGHQPDKAPNPESAIDHEKLTLMQTLLSQDLISKENAVKQLGAFDFFDEKTTGTTTGDFEFDEKELQKNLGDAAEKLAEEIKRNEVYKDVLICQRYAINQFKKRFHISQHIHVDDEVKRIMNVSKKLYNDNHPDNITEEVNAFSDFKLEQLYNESQYKHHFELIG